MTVLKRKLFDKLVNHLGKKQFTIMVGARQTGKSTLLKQLKNYLLKKGEAVYFFNLEDFELLSSFNQHPLNFLLLLSSRKKY